GVSPSPWQGFFEPRDEWRGASWLFDCSPTVGAGRILRDPCWTGSGGSHPAATGTDAAPRCDGDPERRIGTSAQGRIPETGGIGISPVSRRCLVAPSGAGSRQTCQHASGV